MEAGVFALLFLVLVAVLSYFVDFVGVMWCFLLCCVVTLLLFVVFCVCSLYLVVVSRFSGVVCLLVCCLFAC